MNFKVAPLHLPVGDDTGPPGAVCSDEITICFSRKRELQCWLLVPWLGSSPPDFTELSVGHWTVSQPDITLDGDALHDPTCMAVAGSTCDPTTTAVH
ncbi:hypothetical protein U0070_003482, partial [Myodes glareolus]